MYEHSDTGGRLVRNVKIPRRPEKELVRHVNFEVQQGNALESWENREAEKA